MTNLSPTLPMHLFGEHAKANFIVKSNFTLQYRWLAKGTYKGIPAFAKFFSIHDKSTTANAVFDEQKYKDWAKKTLDNSIAFQQEIHGYRGQNTYNVAKLLYAEAGPEFSVMINELIDGEEVCFDQLDTAVVDKVAVSTVMWRQETVTSQLRKWYLHDYDSIQFWLNSTFYKGVSSNSFTESSHTPLVSFYENLPDNKLIRSVVDWLLTKKLSFINSYQENGYHQHSDLLTGWIERSNKLIVNGSNIFKTKTGDVVFNDFDFACYQPNQLLGLCADGVKCSLYMWDQDAHSRRYQTKILKEFAKLQLSFDVDLSWHFFQFIHILLWELPFYVRVFDSGVDKNQVPMNCYTRILTKLSESAKFLSKTLTG